MLIINGNHDKPNLRNESEKNKECPLDALENLGYVKFLGKELDKEIFTIKPFVIQKGEVKIAVYCMGY